MSECNIDGYLNLAAAVVKQAAEDYLRALRNVQQHPRDHDAQRTVKECELFFRQDVSAWTDIDGESIIREIRTRVNDGTRIKMGNP